MVNLRDNDWIKRNTKLWKRAGYTSDQAEQLAKVSMINNFDVGFTAEEAQMLLNNAMGRVMSERII